jgi:biotin-(acetyl-CoA carboxylase) ligase
VFIGIGINVYPCDVPDNLQDIIGFLDPKTPIRNRLAAEIVNGLLDFDKNKLHFPDEYSKRSLSIGRRVNCTVGNETFQATATGIDSLGGLIVQPDGGEKRTLYSGEAKLL